MKLKIVIGNFRITPIVIIPSHHPKRGNPGVYLVHGYPLHYVMLYMWRP